MVWDLSVAEGSWRSYESSSWLGYLVKEDPSTMCTFCFRFSLIRLALEGPLRSCLLRKTVPPVHINFPFLLCLIKILFLPDINHIFDVFPTIPSSSPLSRIRCIANQSRWYKRAHKCACLTMSTAGSIHYKSVGLCPFRVLSEGIWVSYNNLVSRILNTYAHTTDIKIKEKKLND